jgi:non-heme Fe2+,alpha-ketoglutarate-dependent halogenase
VFWRSGGKVAGSMTRLLTEDQRGRYFRDGILFPVPVLAPEEARRYRVACEELESLLGGKPRTVEVRQMHLHFAWAHELATHPRLLDAVEDLLGPDLLVWATELFAKHPHDAAVSIGWHRDRPYMGFSGDTLTAWIALSDSTAANGCLRAVPGPARRDVRSPEGAVDVVLRAGEMSLHDPDIWHGSAPNISDTKRVGFAVRFVTPRTRPRAGRPPVVLARGSQRNGPFRVVDAPAAVSGTGALAEMKESAARHLEAMLANLRSEASLDSPPPCGGRT